MKKSEALQTNKISQKGGESISPLFSMTSDLKDVEKERTLAKTYNSINTTRGKPSRSESGIKEDRKKQITMVRPNTHGSVEVPRRREDKVVDLPLQQDLSKSTIEAIHLFRSLMEKYRERQIDLHIAFLDLEKAYDSVPKLAEGLNNKPEHLREALEENGPWVIREKTEYLRCDFGMDVTAHNEEVDISIGDQILQLKESFRYSGSVIHKSRRIDDHVTHRIRVGWVRWKATSEVLCDKKVPFKLKGKCYRVAIRSAILYGSECWPVIRAQANKVEVAELRTLRWTYGKTMLDMIPNGVFRTLLEVETIISKMRKGNKRWCGHVRRRPQQAPIRRFEALIVDGKRRRDRPKLRWDDRLKLDMKELLLSEDMTSDRNAWRDRISICG
ncbi:hypothetical protein Tco_0958496 [Tanacetum coccineum]